MHYGQTQPGVAPPNSCTGAVSPHWTPFVEGIFQVNCMNMRFLSIGLVSCFFFPETSWLLATAVRWRITRISNRVHVVRLFGIPWHCGSPASQWERPTPTPGPTSAERYLCLYLGAVEAATRDPRQQNVFPSRAFHPISCRPRRAPSARHRISAARLWSTQLARHVCPGLFRHCQAGKRCTSAPESLPERDEDERASADTKRRL